MKKNKSTSRSPRWLFQFTFLLILFLFSACVSKTATMAPRTSAEDPLQAFRQKIEHLRKQYDVPGMSVAVLQKQQVIFAEGFGYADIENEIPATADTPYNIASLTKPFAAALLMGLVEEDRVSLNVEMADILADTHFSYKGKKIQGYASICQEIGSKSKNPFFRYGYLIRNYRCDTESITVKHHLTHTSQGFPGATYRYNGFLFKFLTNVLQEASDRRFDQLLVENITAPLEMNRTVPNFDSGKRDRIMAERAKYYRRGFGGKFVPSTYPVKLSASAGMVSTVLDLAKFDIAMDRNLIVSEETKEKMFTPTISFSGKLLPYGLGWFVQYHKELKLVWHYGYAPKAYSSLILKVPEKALSLILLANSDGASAPFRLGVGNVLSSPIAVAFLNLFTDLNVFQQ